MTMQEKIDFIYESKIIGPNSNYHNGCGRSVSHSLYKTSLELRRKRDKYLCSMYNVTNMEHYGFDWKYPPTFIGDSFDEVVHYMYVWFNHPYQLHTDSLGIPLNTLESIPYAN